MFRDKPNNFYDMLNEWIINESHKKGNNVIIYNNNNNVIMYNFVIFYILKYISILRYFQFLDSIANNNLPCR